MDSLIVFPLLLIFPGGLRPAIYDLSSGIQFKDVHFTYPSRPDMPIFQGLDLDVPAGSITAVVGPSGSGKSTLGSLLLRLYDPERGQVIVGGHDVRALSPDWLRSTVGTVHQVSVDNTSNHWLFTKRHSVLWTCGFEVFFKVAQNSFLCFLRLLELDFSGLEQYCFEWLCYLFKASLNSPLYDTWGCTVLLHSNKLDPLFAINCIYLKN